MTYDVAIVLGTGIKKDGSLPESCLANLKKAIQLYHDKTVSKLIFSGKWAWNCKYTPVMTEAQAMKQIALTQKVAEADILIEENSVTTVSNLCNLKEKILIPNNFESVVLICISDIVKPRMEYNLKMVLGPDFTYEIIMADSKYTPEKYAELKEIEIKKMSDCQKFYKNITPGDHRNILQLAQEDLQNNIGK